MLRTLEDSEYHGSLCFSLQVSYGIDLEALWVALDLHPTQLRLLVCLSPFCPDSMAMLHYTYRECQLKG
jgi:hypothetical protein